MPKTTSFQNLRKAKLIKELKKEKKAKIWKKVADELLRSRRKRREVNLWKINEYSKNSETILIPGKVLGYGKLGHKVNVAGFKFSETAKEKIFASGGKVFSISELMKKNPKGSGIKILC